MELLTLLGPLLAIVPPWAADLIKTVALISLAASFITASVPTPASPEASSTSIHRLWWHVYRLIEFAALVNARVKQRPDVARALVAEAATLVADSGATPLQQAALSAVANHAPPQAVSVLAHVVSEATAGAPGDDRPAEPPPAAQVAARLLDLAGRLR